MIPALVLGAYALALSRVARVLAARGWGAGAPRVAIVVWQCLATSAVMAAALAGCALAFPTLHLSSDIAGLLSACVRHVRNNYASPFGMMQAVAGGILVVAVLARVIIACTRTALQTLHWRREHRAVLAIVGQPSTESDAYVLQQDRPLVYCLPGSARGIVITTGAIQRLTLAQMRTVLAHERGHLHQRHHFVLAWSASLTRAFPRSATLQLAYHETARLIEMRADDAAVTDESDRLELAEALLRMSQADAGDSDTRLNRPSALAAAQTATAQRVRRLIAPPRTATRAQRGLLLALAATMLLIPTLTASIPALIEVSSVHPGE